MTATYFHDEPQPTEPAREIAPVDKLRILSLGGGTQSCALALMSAAGDLPKLDHIVFADTQGEVPETYEYIDYLRGVVEAAGIPLHVVTAGSLYDDLLKTEPTRNNPTPPVHVRNPDGSKGRIGQYRCSYDYKRRIIERKVRHLCGGRGAWKLANVEQWIGFSLDEVGRMRDADGCRCGAKRTKHVGGGACGNYDPWQTNRWPLVELGLKRDDTIRWFAANGHPTPPRSACWFCPNSSNKRWSELREGKPDLFAKAVHLDVTIRHGGGFNARGNQPFAGEMYLHASLVPLADADLRTARDVARDAGQGELFDVDALAMECKTGVCFT
jgi:hypothetical protein